jgi:PAS domain S-box-containing protein
VDAFELIKAVDVGEFIETVPAGVLAISADGRILFANQRVALMSGRSGEEMIGQKIELLLPDWPGGGAKARRRHGQMRRPETPSEASSPDLEFRHRDGTSFPVQVVSSPKGAGGAVVATVLFIRDVADQRRQEATADLLRRRFRLMVEEASEYAIFMLDPDGRVSTWNLGAQRILGYAQDEIVEQRLSIFYPDRDIADGKPGRELAEAAAAGRSEHEGWRIRKDGSRFWAGAVITAQRGTDASLLGFVDVTRDMTERKPRPRTARSGPGDVGTLCSVGYRSARPSSPRLRVAVPLALSQPARLLSVHHTHIAPQSGRAGDPAIPREQGHGQVLSQSHVRGVVCRQVAGQLPDARQQAGLIMAANRHLSEAGGEHLQQPAQVAGIVAKDFGGVHQTGRGVEVETLAHMS